LEEHLYKDSAFSVIDLLVLFCGEESSFSHLSYNFDEMAL
jgi:hypothetical protein